MSPLWFFVLLAAPLAGQQVTELERGADSPAPGPKTVLLGNGLNLLGGWNHIPSDPSLAMVSLGPRAAAYDPASLVWDDSGSDRSSVDIVLVKKLGDWDGQHANGLEGRWGGLACDEITGIVIDVKLDTARSKIPTASELKQRYGDWLSDADLAALDGQKAILRVTLTGVGFAWSAETWLVIDPLTQGDRWLRFTIPMEDFAFFTGDPWNQKPLDRATLAGAEVSGVRIEPETQGNRRERWGQVVRNFRPELWTGAGRPPETVKEMALRLAAVYATVKLRS
jgi:hypothetical protein